MTQRRMPMLASGRPVSDQERRSSAQAALASRRLARGYHDRWGDGPLIRVWRSNEHALVDEHIVVGRFVDVRGASTSTVPTSAA